MRTMVPSGATDELTDCEGIWWSVRSQYTWSWIQTGPGTRASADRTGAAICMVVLGSADRSSQDEIKANILSAALSSLPTTTFLQVPAS